MATLVPLSRKQKKKQIQKENNSDQEEKTEEKRQRRFDDTLRWTSTKRKNCGSQVTYEAKSGRSGGMT